MITKEQKQVLKAINDFIISNNYLPSVRELVSFLNLKSIATIQGHLDKLQANGSIERNKNMPRTLHFLCYQQD